MLTLHLIGAVLSPGLVITGGVSAWKQSPYMWLIIAIPVAGMW